MRDVIVREWTVAWRGIAWKIAEPRRAPEWRIGAESQWIVIWPPPGDAQCYVAFRESLVAVYYNLCVDCGDDALLADSLASRFDGFVLQVEGHDDVRCKSLRTSERGIQFVGAEPVGMGYATLPESLRRPELTEPDAIETIRDTLYNELKRFPGFRRAIFGAECWDQLVFATVDEDADIDFGWMIFSTKTFPNDPDECVIEQYIDGYRMVVRRKTAT